MAGDKEKLSIAVVSMHKQGHLAPVLYLCSELCKRGHQVCVYMPEIGKNDFEKKIKETGAALVALDMQGYSDETIKSTATASRKHVFTVISNLMCPALRKEFSQKRPDVVLADFASIAGCLITEEMKLPLVLNMPGPLSLMQVICGLPDTSTGVNCFGLHLARQRFSALTLVKWLGLGGLTEWGKPLRNAVGRGAMVLVQTIWGLDKPMPIYPNFIVTGPVLPPAAALRDGLAKHVELQRFLRAAPEGVVYVTTGSLVKLEAWQVRVIFNGLKKAKCRVVWSLKEEKQEFLPSKEDPDFFISKWLPQAELLQDPAIKLVITHCGWGGIMETLIAGKPMVAVPFFGDQPQNAKLIQQRGLAELIGRIPTGAEGTLNPYKEGWITEDSVCSAVTKVMNTPSYAAKAAELMIAFGATGGVATAAQHVEWAARYGTSHVKPENFSYFTGSNPFNGLVVGLGLCAVGLCKLSLF